MKHEFLWKKIEELLAGREDEDEESQERGKQEVHDPDPRVSDFS